MRRLKRVVDGVRPCQQSTISTVSQKPKTRFPLELYITQPTAAMTQRAASPHHACGHGYFVIIYFVITRHHVMADLAIKLQAESCFILVITFASI